METLRKNKILIIGILSEESSYILQHVEQRSLITRREYNNLHNSTQSNENTIINLLDKLMGKDDKTCKDFLALLEEQDIVKTFPRLREISKNTNLPSDHTSGPVQPLPFPSTDVSVPEASVTGGNQLSLYEMSSVPRGICLIINNENFQKSKRRTGTDKDAMALAKVFSRLKFTVVKCQDKTAAEICNVLKVVSELNELSDLKKCAVKEWVAGQFTELKHLPEHGDAFVCCILSHGEKEGVCGTDGTVVHTRDILSPFNGSNCRKLVEKPKLFFIQACRGGDVQDGVPVYKKRKVEEMDRVLETDNVPVQECTLPGSDFLVFMANVEQYLSFREPASGSWFIQSLCRQLEESCTRATDIHDIHTKVKAEVSKKEAKMYCKLAKQSPEVIETLTKKLIFPAENTATS
ncbi:hypothetical protein UPYG_G00294290 [Umbra pygmaea]|uniref:Caspase-8-like n=1 Tax=Umbra pygmaea TaxID=75934 RepID=A0ABD0WLF8_UMBPY